MIRAELAPFNLPHAPVWARPDRNLREISEAEALFFAGAALSALDSVAKSEPPWAGAWRARLALKSAAAVAQNLLNRREDETALRDAVALAKPGQDLGPAGRVYSAFRTLCGPGDPFRPKRLAAVAADLQAPLDLDGAGELAAALAQAAGRGRPAPTLAAAAAEMVIKMRTDAEPLALFCADAALARALAWPVAVPLLAGELFSRKTGGDGRWPRPGETGWGKLTALAYARAALAALDLAHDLSRRAAQLADAAPKLRAKGKTGAITALLGDDAISAAAPIPGLSDRARRRLFERLVTLGAARELTGRATFRLYGL
ncbi:uncharacterized protein DUF1403 [Roseiarcus fermentans]|uniref:Uncharacterized protein DUF1403 n=1 Tax=Roseiarcus fermentans TaxID=1473586 RepID=A0A366FED3_9HYPH|nr:DUF1403 family protein [Roseiarcus fermentans]RBP13043.1 uncharacterized protein DUF1403 [Roseiarcus fermentans]